MDTVSAGCANERGTDSDGVDVREQMGCTSIRKMMVLNVLQGKDESC